MHNGVIMTIRPIVEACVLRKPPASNGPRTAAKEPHREREDFPWFWLDGTFTGERVNDAHLTHAKKKRRAGSGRGGPGGPRMMDQRPPGARWLRCDLHVHTPFDMEKRFGENLRAAIEAHKKEKPQRLAEIAERFIWACRSAADGAGIDVIALTDHNSIDGYRYLKPQFDALDQQAADQGLSMPAILPGCELSVGGERPIHFLVIFAAETDLGGIDRALGHVFGTNDRFDPKTGTPRATGQSVDDFLERLFDYCRPASGDRHMEFVVLPAHADDRRGVLREIGGGVAQGSNEIAVSASLWDEMKGHLRQRVITRRDWNGFQTIKPFGKLPQAYRELLWRWAAARRGEDWEQLTEGQRARYREQQHWPLVECSDPHNYETIGSSFSWLKMEVPDIEGIRLALLDPASRLRRMADGPPGHTYPRIERLRVRETDFFKEIDVITEPVLDHAHRRARYRQVNPPGVPAVRLGSGETGGLLGRRR